MQKTPVAHPPILLIFLFYSGLGNYAYAQAPVIKGKITDTTEKKNLFNSSVPLLKQSDSILIQATRTNKDGDFLFKGIAPGRYLILVTYPAYADYADSLEVKDSLPLYLPPIGLVLKSTLLEQVVVTGNKGAIHIKGDTVEFRADSFRTQAGANVEELLKKLPGIQIDKNGKITAQGQKIQKVLVDGEEFFGDDPTLVTQNLRADMVDKVQVYDKKSDQAAFTGIDDGEKTKTINLKLKDSKKNGYFGRISAAAGTDGYYDTQAMLNLFKKKKKLAAYGIISNTGKTGLNWGDRNSFGQSIESNLDYDETTGDLSFNGNFDDLDSWDGRYNGEGRPAVKTGGIHYNNKWEEDRQSVNGNYKFMQLDVKNSSQTNSQFILPDTFYYNNQRSVVADRITRHKADGSYEIKFDSSSSLKITADGGVDHKTTQSEFFSEALASDSNLVNRNDRKVSTIGDTRNLNSNLLWRKKLPKKGRTISFNFRENYSTNTSDGHVNSYTQFYQNGLPFSDSLLDQYKNYRSENIQLDSRITYTEPLSRVSFLSANYGVSVNNSHSDRSSYNKSPNGKYEELDSLYSNNYQFNVFSQKGGLVYSFIKKKFRFNAGGNIGLTNFVQRDIHADTVSKRDFINWYPQASFTYSFSSQRRLTFQYNGSMLQPTLQQIQPIRNNEDNLNIIQGNPDLKAQFRNDIRVYFNDYKVISDRNIWASLGYTFTPNAISTDVNVYAGGKRVTQSINVNGNYSLYGNIDYGFKWKKPDLHIRFSGNISQSNQVSVVNNVENTTESGDYALGFGFYKAKEKKYEAGFNSRTTYTQSRSSINTGIVTDYWTYTLSPNLDIFLPFKFQIHADCDINLRQKTSVFNNNNNTVLLYAWIGKKFLKNDALQLKASGNDLLNQNIGFNRTVNSNFISQNRYSTIQRYFLFSVIWNFNKAGTASPANRD